MNNSLNTFEDYCRKSVAEGIVLLETNGTLPLNERDKVAVFGRAQFEYQKSGTGSGGDVRCPYVTNIIDELQKRVTVDQEIVALYKKFIEENPFDEGDGWLYPKSQKQPILDEECIKSAKQRNDKAIYVLCRLCGEGQDCFANKGDWYLSDEEEQNLSVLCKYFPNLIVLINTGNIMDMSWVKKYDIKTVAYIWQGGQEGGVGTVDALMGDIAPSGRLTDTIATHIDKYSSTANFGDKVKNIHVEDIYVGYRYFETFAQDEVLYPFGYGLNYTEFIQQTLSAKKEGDTISLQVKVENIGQRNGKDVVEVYYEAPQGVLGNPKRQLIAFKKTQVLEPKQEEVVNLSIDVKDMASYDDSGKTGFPFAYVLQKGAYKIYSGQNVREAQLVFEFSLEKNLLVKQCTQALAPTEDFERMAFIDNKMVLESVPKAKYTLLDRIKQDDIEEIAYTGNKGIKLKDVADAKATLNQFVAQADLDMLCQIVRGEGMCSPKAASAGTASVLGGTSPKWSELGVPVVSTCDGPSGIRLNQKYTVTCIPSGALIASSWSPEAFEPVFDLLADEMVKYHVDFLLAPGINIHRNPLGGRNFEYFSEDPYLTGVNATMIAKTFSNKGVYCTLKHFACNTQETSRASENEVISERAIREIYLKGFEIPVKSGCVQAIMTSYNRINGVSACSNYDLVTTILRGEWGYKGFVMTDWWPVVDDLENDTFRYENLSAMIKAQSDIYMVVSDAATHSDDLQESLDSGKLSVGALQRSAKNILAVVLKSHAFSRGEEGIWKGDDTLYLAKDVLLEKTDFSKEIKLDLASHDNYIIELEYLNDGDVLEQFDLIITINNLEDLVVTVNKTNKVAKTARLTAYLGPGKTIQVKSKEIRAVRILKY